MDDRRSRGVINDDFTVSPFGEKEFIPFLEAQPFPSSVTHGSFFQRFFGRWPAVPRYGKLILMESGVK
jgi:hypothetical protein